MLASKAHVKIGGIEYMLDESIDNHYIQRFEPRIISDENIAGDPDKVNAITELLYWTITGWTGGEGARVWDADFPTVYDYSGALNARIKGQLTGRPERDSTTVASSTDDADQRCYLELAQGHAWLAGGEVTKSSSDYGETFSAETNGITAGDKVTATAGDDEFLYVASGNSTNREIRRVNVSSTNAAVITRAAGQRLVGMTIVNGRLYAWTGRKLFECDIAETVPLTLNDTYRKVYDTGVDLDYANFGGATAGSWWADCIPSENSVIFWVGTEGQTVVYEYKFGAARPIWKMPFGFTGKSSVVQNGVLFISGHWSGEGTADGFGAAYYLPLDTRRPGFVNWFRKNQGTNLQMQEMANSYGNQILVAGAKSGLVFVYDAEFDGVTLLDDISGASGWSQGNSKIGDMLTIGKHRLVAFYQPQTAAADDYTVLRYKSDEPTHRENSGSLSELLETGTWDVDRPHTMKALLGFLVHFQIEDAATTSGLLANQRVIIKYYRDGQAVETAGTVTSASTVSGTKGRVFIQVSDDSTTKKFMEMKMQITLDNNATGGVQLPILKSVSALCTPLDMVESWDLILRAKEEPNNNARPQTSPRKGSKIRDSLEDLAENKNLVQFLDGYRYRGNNEYTTHTVIVEEITNVIMKLGEGVTRVRLRSVDPSG